MNHAVIEEQSLVDRYIQGRLTAAERIDFEDHFIACEQCLEQLELAEAFQTGMRDAVADQIARHSLAAGVLARLFAARRAVAFAALCLLALPVAWMLGRGSGGPALQPQANITTHSFGISRSEGAEEVLTVQAGEWLVLEMPAEGDAFPHYRLTLLREGEETPQWWEEGLEPDRRGLLRVTFPPGYLAVGVFRLRLEGVGQDGGAVPLADYRLRVE